MTRRLVDLALIAAVVLLVTLPRRPVVDNALARWWRARAAADGETANRVIPVEDGWRLPQPDFVNGCWACRRAQWLLIRAGHMPGCPVAGGGMPR